MCTHSHNASDRQRAHQELMMLHSSNPRTCQSNEVRTATIYTAEILTSAADDRNGGILRSSTARAVLAIASIALLLTSSIGLGTSHAANIKDLSHTVMSLTQQLHTLEVENENKIHEVETLEKQVNDKDIELAWEIQHVANQKESQELMYQGLARQIQKDEEEIQKAKNFTDEISNLAASAQRELDKEKEASISLKLALASALNELASARKQLPGRSIGGKKNNDIDGNDRKLRGVSPYQLGDTIEIIEYEEGGTVAFRPGIVSDVNKDGTFNLVKIQEGILLSDMKIDQFQRYHPYEEGSSAFLQQSRNSFVPITIVKFCSGPQPRGGDIMGSYQYTIDESTSKIVTQSPAILMHR